MYHAPVTRVCSATMFTPVPFGVQMAWLSCNRSGKPPDVTRVPPVIHCAVTHGTGEPLTLKGQPAIIQGSGCCTVGWPETVTRGLGTRACALPPCIQSTVAP